MSKRFQLPEFSVGDTVKTPDGEGVVESRHNISGKNFYFVNSTPFAGPELKLISKAKPPKKGRKTDDLPF